MFTGEDIDSDEKRFDKWLERFEERAVLASLAGQTATFTAFSSFRINTRREGLGDCLYRFGSLLCNFPVTSRFWDRPHDAYSKPV